MKMFDKGQISFFDTIEMFEKIARSFRAEGWKDVPFDEKESAIHELNGWIDERNMDSMEPRKGTRFFIMDVAHLKWNFYFKIS